MPEHTSIVAADPELDQYSLHRSHGSESRFHHRRAHLFRGCSQAWGLGLVVSLWLSPTTTKGAPAEHQQGTLIVKAGVIAARGYRGGFLGYEQPGARVNTELQGPTVPV